MYSLFPAAIAVLFLGYGLYVLKLAGATRISLTFFLLCLTTFAWQFTWAVLFQVEDQALADVLVRVGYLFILFLPTSLYHFLVEVTERRDELGRVGASYGVAALMVLTLFPTNLVVDGWYDYFFGYYPRAGVLHPLHVLQTCIVVLRGLYLTWQAQLTASPRLRIRLRYCVTSLLIYLFAAVDYLGNYGVEHYPPGVFLISVSLGLMAVATVKHQLMDVSVALTHGIARFATLLIFALTWSGGYLMLVALPSEPLHPSAALGVGLVFLILVGEGYMPLWRFLQGLPGRLMRSDRPVYQSGAAMQAVSRALASHISLADMMRDLERALVVNSRLRGLRVFLRDDFSEAPDYVPTGHYLSWDIRQGVINYQERIPAAHPLLKHLRGPGAVAHLRELGPVSAELLQQWRARSALGVKLDGKLIAVLLIGAEGRVAHYSCEDLDLIDFLPAQLSLGLDRVQAYARLCHSLSRTQKSASLMALMNEYQHELKAPVSIMHMYAQADLPPQVLREEVRVQCDRVLGLLDKMVRVLRDNRTREERPVDLNAIARSALRLFPVPGLRVHLDLDPRLPRLPGDADDLLILFVNLLKNASEATDPARENRITISTRWLRDPSAVKLTVEDTGTGIPEERVRRIWLPADSDKPGGNGMGLKVMQRIVGEHGGEVRITSVPGRGTCFEARLPLTTRSAVEEVVPG